MLEAKFGDDPSSLAKPSAYSFCMPILFAGTEHEGNTTVQRVNQSYFWYFKETALSVKRKHHGFLNH